jgi:hypothetical protein
MVDETKTQETKLHPGRGVMRTESAKPKRHIFNDGIEGPFYIDPSTKPSDKDYRWVRAEIEGREDSINVKNALREGWEPVPPDRHPEHTFTLKKTDIKPDYIESNGHILMERDKSIGEEYKERIAKETEAQVNSVNWAIDGGVDKSAFVVDNNKVNRTFQGE